MSKLSFLKGIVSIIPNMIRNRKAEEVVETQAVPVHAKDVQFSDEQQRKREMARKVKESLREEGNEWMKDTYSKALKDL